MAVNKCKSPIRPAIVEDRYTAPALDKGLDILELLAHQDGGLAQRQIADSLGRSTSEIFRMLSRLEQRGYLLRSRPDDLYYLSAKLYALAHRHPPTHRLHEAALPVLRNLARRIDQSCHLGVVHDGQLLIQLQVDAPGFMGFAVRPGTCVPLHQTSSGAVLLAYADKADRLRWYEQSPEAFAIGDRQTLEARLPKIRRRGYEQQPSRTVRGITDISVPVLDHNHNALATVTVPYLGKRSNEQSIAQIRRHILDAAAELSRLVGYELVDAEGQ